MSMEIWLCPADTSCQNCLSAKCLHPDQRSFTLGAETAQRDGRAVSPGWHLLSPLGLPALTSQYPTSSFSWLKNKDSNTFLTPARVVARMNEGTEKALNA